jgi:hypothetical protein
MQWLREIGAPGNNMMKLILDVLEWLAKYGLIEIFFGVGILAYIKRKFHTRPRRYIEGVDILPTIPVDNDVLEIEIVNNSRETLYLHHARFRPGYETSRLDRTSLGTIIRTSFFVHWVNDRLPPISSRQSRNLAGECVLSAIDSEGNKRPAIFLEPGERTGYLIDLEDSDLTKRDWDSMFQDHALGVLTFHYMHGSANGMFQSQV